MYRFIFFDLDGTLTDSKAGIINCARYAIQTLGDTPPEENVLVEFVGPPLQDSFQQLCGYSPEKCQEAIRLFRERYARAGQFENCPAPGMAAMLERLRNRGLRLALASSKMEHLCENICRRFGFAPYLDAIAGSPPEGDSSKAAVLRNAMDRLGVGEADLSQCLMVGDRKYDAEGAADCGIGCVGVDFFGCAAPGELEQAGVLAVVQTVDALEQFICGERPQ